MTFDIIYTNSTSWGDEPLPHFSILSVDVPDSVAPGSTVNITVTVANDGSGDGSVTIRVLDSNSNEVASQTVTLASGNIMDVSLSFTAPSTEGTYTYTVIAHNNATDTDDDQTTFDLNVEQPQAGNPHFTIINVDAPSSVSPGDVINVTVTVKNDGDTDGEVTVNILDSNNDIMSSHTETISAGAQSSMDLEFTAPSSEGTYTYTVVAHNNATGADDDQTTFTVTVEEQQPSNPHFVIESVSTQDTVPPNGIIDVIVVVRNDGNASGQVTVKILDSNNNEIKSQSKTISAGAQSSVSLSFNAPSSEGTYTYTVVAHNDVTGVDDSLQSFSITVQSQENVPHFTITNINYPSAVSANSMIYVSVTIANDGDADGVATVHIYRGTELVATKSVNVVAGSTATANLSWTAPATPGSYDYEVRVINNETGNLDALQSITIEVTEEGQPPSGGETTQSWLQQYWWLIIIIAVILLLLLIMTNKRR